MKKIIILFDVSISHLVELSNSLVTREDLDPKYRSQHLQISRLQPDDSRESNYGNAKS